MVTSETHIYFVRHGRVYNPENIFYGRLSGFRLAEDCLTDLESTASYLKTKCISQIFTSPLLRTRQTALILQRTLDTSNLSVDKHLIEVNSYLEGKPFALGKQNRFDHYFSDESRESMNEVADRNIH
jgi:broad specificity phosphatase PhoE